MTNTIMLTDSYKLSHFNQYPSDMTAMQSYLTARSSLYKDIVFFGLEYLIQSYLTRPITEHDIVEAEVFAKAHGVPFNTSGFERTKELGYWPVKIIAKPEGAVCNTGETLLTIESTDPESAWVVNYLETLLMKVWYPSTVASKSLHVRKILENWYEHTGAEKAGLDFAYHNFGDRGSSSVESASIGGAGHLTSFMGTDNFNSLKLISNTYFHSDAGVGFSIPATEHSTVTSWGRENEFKMIENYLESNKGQQIIACVLDSYNIYNAVEFVTSHLKSRIESDEYPAFVIRPDSGNPLDIIPSIFSILENNKVKYTTHSASGVDYKLFTKYRIIWGDGVTPEAIDDILKLVVALGYSPANVNFGSGGDLMQNVNRDTCGFAMKCCAIKRGNGDWLPVFKEPMHDGFKKSSGGFKEVENGVEYYNNGYTHSGNSFADIRGLVKKGRG